MAQVDTPTSSQTWSLRSALSLRPFSSASYIFLALAYCSAALIWTDYSSLIVFVAAMLWGWSEIDGRCGRAHICSLAVFHNLDQSGRTWRNAIAAYTVGGLITASAVGCIVGFLGELIPISQSAWAVILVSASAVLLCRELGALSFSLPQMNRQTHKGWAVDYGTTVGAGMWGAHIGLAFATVVKHSGFYALILISAALAPPQAAALFATYWLGRTLPMWIAPLLRRGAEDNSGHTADEMVNHEIVFRHVAAGGLALAIVGLLADFLT